ncbi:MAG: phospholipase D-like domain-containing protein [bacterium]|nr:phospholipase D-like domain-containing protein [bacterium]
MPAVQDLAAESLTLLQVAALAFAALGEVLAVVFVYRILVRGGSPAGNLLWVAIILAAPWLGLLLYYLLPRRLQLRTLERIQRRGQKARENLPEGSDAEPAEELPVESQAAESQSAAMGRAGVGLPATGLVALLQHADVDGECGLCAGNTIEWIPGGEEFFAAAEAAIESAKRQIHCEVYILRADAAGLRFLECLTAAARRGVVVRLLFDSIGSFGLKSKHLAPLREAGGRAVAFLPLLWKRRPFTINLRNHRKSLIVDGEAAFVGGRNIADEYRTGRFRRTMRWLDAMVALRGPAVRRVQGIFVEGWCTATGEVLEDALVPTAPPVVAGLHMAAVASGPDRERQTLWYAIVQAIGDAEQSIELCSPYMLPPPKLFFALETAVARGVRVRLFTNGRRAETAVLYWAQRSFYRRLLAVGVEIHETDADYDHTKLLVVDRRTVLIGSANMDLRSAALNFEIAVVAVDAPDLAREVLGTVEARQQGRHQVREEGLPRNPIIRALDGLASLASPLF